MCNVDKINDKRNTNEEPLDACTHYAREMDKNQCSKHLRIKFAQMRMEQIRAEHDSL